MKSEEINDTKEIQSENNSQEKTQANKPVEIPEVLSQPQALQILVDAARIAQSKGVFTLDDAALVHKAITTFMPKGPLSSNQ